MLLAQEETMTISALSERAQMGQANTSTLCKKLERSGYLTRTRGEQDERIVTLALTGDGRQALDRTGARAGPLQRPAGAAARVGEGRYPPGRRGGGLRPGLSARPDQRRARPMLKLSQIKKSYTVGDNTVEALRGVDLEFRENEFSLHPCPSAAARPPR